MFGLGCARWLALSLALHNHRTSLDTRAWAGAQRAYTVAKITQLCPKNCNPSFWSKKLIKHVFYTQKRNICRLKRSPSNIKDILRWNWIQWFHGFRRQKELIFCSNFWIILDTNYQCGTAYQLEVIELRQVRAQHSLTLSVNCQARLVVPEPAARRRQLPALQVGQIAKKPPKIRFKNSWNWLTDTRSLRLWETVL